MKYIRTKDGIVCKWIKQTTPFTIKCLWRKNIEIIVEKNDIIAQADTIEELCDEFVEKWKSSINRGFYHIVCNAHIRRINNETKMNLKNVQKGELEIYGAIWTDKGLIYVAKMNEKGELELL